MCELGADNLPRPGLMLPSGRQVGDDHLNGLKLYVLGRNRAHFVGHLIPFHWHIFPLNIWDVNKYVFSSMGGANESMTLWPWEVLANALEDRSRFGSYGCWIGACAFGWQWTKWFPCLGRFPLWDITTLSQERQWKWDRCMWAVRLSIRCRRAVWISHWCEVHRRWDAASCCLSVDISCCGYKYFYIATLESSVTISRGAHIQFKGPVRSTQ